MGHGFSAGRSTDLSSCPFFLTHRKLPEFTTLLCRIRSGMGISLSLCWARRKPGAANVHDRNVSKSFCHSALGSQTVEESHGRTAWSHFAQRHRPITFAAEGLRFALCFTFNCGTEVYLDPAGSLRGLPSFRSIFCNLSSAACCFSIAASRSFLIVSSCLLSSPISCSSACFFWSESAS